MEVVEIKPLLPALVTYRDSYGLEYTIIVQIAGKDVIIDAGGSAELKQAILDYMKKHTKTIGVPPIPQHNYTKPEGGDYV